MGNEYNDFKFKKKFGQNFLQDQNILDKIAIKSNIDKDTLVIEVGVGAAALTMTMSPFAKNILGYEIDTSLKDILDEKLKLMNNVEIIYGDFLEKDVVKDIKKYNYKKLYVVANLPYYITTPIINKIVDEIKDINKIVVMVQKEVGERFNAKKGTKDYGSLTVFLNYFFDINKIIDVSRNCFMPKPNVDSVVVEMVRHKGKYNVIDEKLFFKLVRDSFKYKRKNLRNNLKGYNLEKVEKVLSKYNLDLTVRAEAMDIDLFVEISNELSNNI